MPSAPRTRLQIQPTPESIQTTRLLRYKARRETDHLWNGGATMGLCGSCMAEGIKASRPLFAKARKLVEIGGRRGRLARLQARNRLRFGSCELT